MLQIYVWLIEPEIGSGALLSIAISALTTGFSSAMIAFDKDVDVQGRKVNPDFYGYIPDDHNLRERCFLLMTLISASHNVSRSIGCALLLASGGLQIFYFIGGEVLIYFVYKILR